MKRNLLKQMATEWRDNIWLILGLAIVTIAIWLLGLNMWFQIFGYLEPRGFEPTDVFCGTLSSVDEEVPNTQTMERKRLRSCCATVLNC